MKKFGLLALIAVCFASCGDEITQVVEPNTFTNFYRIYAEDMVTKTDVAGTYYEFEIREPKLTGEIFNYGILQAFLRYTKEGKETYSPLPFSDFIVDAYGRQWEEQFTVEFQSGTIKFIQKISDHATDLPVAEYYEVMVRFLW
ncbi:MAG: hypothetical protein LBB64_04555 [Dysgonamonadaceae bacterium]|jgi:hypothetical protein|nr:hypothetical protein [Dysgonamonadaceae bacterium]